MIGGSSARRRGGVALAWAADLAYACPSCASPLEENRQAFVDTTVFLTVVPLMMMGGFIWWLRRRIRAMDDRPGDRGSREPAARRGAVLEAPLEPFPDGLAGVVRASRDALRGSATATANLRAANASRSPAATSMNQCQRRNIVAIMMLMATKARIGQSHRKGCVSPMGKRVQREIRRARGVKRGKDVELCAGRRHGELDLVPPEAPVQRLVERNGRNGAGARNDGVEEVSRATISMPPAMSSCRRLPRPTKSAGTSMSDSTKKCV